MKIYKNRKELEYLKRLSQILDIDNLKKSAILLPKPKNNKGNVYSKFIRIDIQSFTASTLLDASNSLDSNNFYKQFRHLLLNNDELRKEGIFIKVRFLMEYPFSISSYSRIQAETSFLRASIEEPTYFRDFQLLEQLDKDGFDMAFSVNLQKSNLIHLQNLECELREKFDWNSTLNPSSLKLKFTPISLGTCFLIINDTIFYDPYLLAKANRNDSKLTLDTPVVELNEDSNKTAFKSFEDHFRYCWELDTTLDCEDATFFNFDKIKSLSKYRTPQQISFENKATKISLIKGVPDDDKKINSWKKLVSNNFQKLCTDLSPSIANETLFITCSWNRDEDDISTPNNNAQFLNKYLHEDFVNIDVPLFSVQIMQATPSEFLSNQLYQTLDSTTIGVIFMTKDIKGEDNNYYCKPNVYHELGYLMKQLGKSRLLILKEQDVVPPSNIQDIIRFDFNSNKMTFRYHDILEQLLFISNIPKDIFTKALDNHINRLNNFLQNGEINSVEFQSLKSKILNMKSKYEKNN